MAGCLAVVAAAASPLAGQQRGFEPTDYYRIVDVSQPAMSPTGAYVAFTVTHVIEEENRRHREVWLQPLSGGRPDGEAIRFSDPTSESSDPAWSPDGSLLSFRSMRGDDPNRIWFLRVDGPGGEAFHIDGVEGAPVWSPNGQSIAFARGGEEDGDDGDEGNMHIAPDAVTSTLDDERFDGHVITAMGYKRDGVHTLLPHYSLREKTQLYVVSAEGGTARRLTDLDFDVGGVEWSPDGRRIYFTGDERQDDEYNRDNTNDIWSVAVTGGSVRRLTINPGSESAPALSPDGGSIAFLSSPARGDQSDILVQEVGSDGSLRGVPVNLTADWDLQPGAPSWSGDGGQIRFSAGTGGNSHLFAVAAAAGEIRQITAGDRRLSGFSFSENDRVMAFTATDPVTPSELYVAAGDGSTEQKATGFNDDWLSDITLMPAERIAWMMEDSIEVEGWVVRPVGEVPGRSYPMVLKIHGGPHGAYGNTFFRTFHILSNAGFFVLYANPRGSTGYGHDFTYAITGGWGEIEAGDLLAGVDAAREAYPDIDRTRIGVSGGSYGGFMTNWLTATTDRFAAAVTSRSIADWTSLYGSSDAQDLLEFGFGGPPWEQRELYARLSPITHVERVRTPTLIIHGENDYRTPIGDGEKWFMALKKRGVPTELVRYPRSSHGLSRTGEPWLLVDRLERIRSWFTYWLVEQAGQ
jgi:dipeptidyl aminopeptidase/acylaminoacyl peptidase